MKKIEARKKLIIGRGKISRIAPKRAFAGLHKAKKGEDMLETLATKTQNHKKTSTAFHNHNPVSCCI